MNDYHGPLAAAVEAARAAGALLRDDFLRPGGPRGSGSHADADTEAERLIRDKLLAALPCAYRGEETGFADKEGDPHLWLVDPNDGTSAYLKGWRGSAVSIALLRDGVPVLGVVYAFCYPDGEGDLIAWAEGCGPVTRNGKPVQVDLTANRLEAGRVVFVSQDADNCPAANTDCVRPARYIALPSIAYRLARVAVGDGVAAVSLAAPGGWDYAAGHALLRAGGGVLLDQDGQPVTYTRDGQSATRRCFGGAPEAVQELRQRDWQKVFIAEPMPPAPFRLVRPAPGRAIADNGVLSRAQGCLLGQLAGDALGGLVEFKSAMTIEMRYPGGCRELKDGGTWNNLAGQPTDDSELALMLARTLVHRGTYDAESVLEAYAEWYDDPQTFDIGGTTRQALRAAFEAPPGERVRETLAQNNQHSQANGSLMRISPLGIFGAGRVEQAVAWARQDSQLTHPHQVCQDSCAIFVAAIVHAITHGGDPTACYEAALAEASKPGVHADVLLTIEKARWGAPGNYSDQMGWVRIALQNAFHQLLHAPNFEEGVVATVMAGGDTDTNAAIAGALLGAVHGREAVPPRWIHALLSCRPLRGTPTSHPRAMRFWPVDALELAESLLCAGR
ncbi:MAG TPA: inositol monophosphatase family protein [Gemmataceae bacterium]|nr:inositol monophosphatase family protein [Gemmataceae bacterium]